MFFGHYIKHIVFSITLITIALPLSGQWQFHSTITHEYNSNPFYFPEPQSLWITSTEFGFGKDLEKVSYYYTGNYFLFNDLADRNFYWHQLTVSGTAGKIGWNVLADQRINKTEDNIYDYFQVKTNLNYKFMVQQFHFFTSGTINFINFPNLEELNSWTYSGNIKIVRSFPTRTTFLGGANVTYKKYINMVIVPEDTTGMNASILYSIESGSSGSGSGSGGGGSRGRGGSGVFIQDETETPTVSTSRMWIRIAQSLLNKAGIAVQYQKQFILSGNNRLYIGDVLNYQLEDLIFDDPMNYESDKIGAEFTWLLPRNFRLKSIYYRTDKNYITQGIYKDEELYSDEVKRSDENTYLDISFTKQFSGFPGKNNAWTTGINYSMVDNNSNSYWYNYKNKVTAFNLTFYF